ncbi:MAG: ABC transporter permease [Candidatus Hodarchaeaceae archaeon]|nr:ABC transporter permease [Candidatus Hodarchaeaceae archaeon]
MNAEFEKLKVVTKYELLKQVRRRRFYGALILVVIAEALAIALYKGLNIPEALPIPIPDSPKLFALFVAGMGSSVAVLAAVFFAGDSIASEFERKTGYILFPNPVKRSTLVVGKYAACFIVTAVVLVSAYALASAALVGMYRQLPVEVLGSLGLALLLGCSILGLAFLFSSLLKGGMGATIATLLLFMLIFPIIRMGLTYSGREPWFTLDYAADSVSSVYGIPFAEMWQGPMGGMALMTPDPTTSLFVMLAYFVAPFVMSIWITKRREML